MTIETGALEQGYVKLETAYNVVPADALAGTDGIRILTLSLSGKKNREPSPQKRGTPDRQASLPRRESASWNLSEIMWEPSGTLGTISNVGKLIKGGFGSNHVLSLTTTVSAAPSPTVTTATLGSVTGIQVGDLIVFTVASGARREVTRIATLPGGAAVTFDPLSVAPDSTGAAVVGITYSLASNITDSFAIYKYHNAGGFKEAVYGSVVDQIQVMLDGTKEVTLALSGPGARYGNAAGGATVQTKPATHVTVGNPAGGMVGNFYVDGTAFLVTSAKVSINNQLALRNKDLGTSFAAGIGGRSNLRDVTVEVTFFMEDTNLIGKAHSVTKGELRCIIGNTNGSMLLVVVPSVEFEIPDIPSDIGLKEVTITGVAYAVNGNDQVILGEA